MNKKDIAAIRRQLKPENDLLTIKDIFNVYILKESSDIYHHQHQPFEMLEDEQKELFLANFKKVLTGNLDEKLFELKFQQNVENSSQLILHRGLVTDDTEQWKLDMLEIVNKMLADRQYEMDIVVTFMRAEFYKPVKETNEETEENSRDAVYSHKLILCSVNKTEDPRKELQFDYIEKMFTYNIVVNPVINLKAPLSGFLFPAITDNAQDVNRVLYSCSKANEPDEHFIDEVLNAEETYTAKDDKAVFEEVVRDVTEDRIDTSTLASVYEEINELIENHDEGEPAKLDARDIENVLKSSGVENVQQEKIQEALKQYTDDEHFQVKAQNIVPKYASKSIKINTKVANIAVSPQDLRHVRQVVFDGKRYLMIEVEEDAIIDGFKVIPEALL